ncbi:MAG: 1,6-anhydro-N-acetylmuramyl-L-alanine amidase AmpD [Burkholderiales bacterium]|nr:1,6-anhydro-N-acetylmuramyl-L-alanine amidase AmpD [Burkholderiales bacterium]
MLIGEDGLLAGAPFIPSPHFDERPAGVDISLIVVHGISLPPNQFGGDEVARLFTGTLNWDAHPYFQGLRGMRVSAHFYVRRSGRVLQFVSCRHRAWHAGASRWAGRERCNDFSVGIELEGADHIFYTDAQYERLAQLCAALRCRYPIRDIVGHADIAPGRKTDPGPAFDWQRLHETLATL